MEWQLAEAKNRLSDVLNRALVEGPQRVLRGDDVVIVIAERDYEELTGTRRSFKAFLLGRGSGSGFEGADLTRDRSLMRETRF